MKFYLISFLFAALCSWQLTPLLTRLGHRLHAYGRGRVHREFVPIPRLGGIAIFAVLLTTLMLFLAASPGARISLAVHWRNAAMFLLPAAMVLLLGVFDDLRGTRPWPKLLIETAAAAIAWQAGVRILSVPLLGIPIRTAALSFLLTVFWLVTVTNAFNLIDGLDGLATGVAFFVAVSLFLVSVMQASPWLAVLSITLAGALLGFLRFNFSPAKIFLGDCGSLFLGFVLAMLASRASLKSPALVAIAVPYVAFGLPLFDTSLAVIRRFLSGQRVFQPDCDHIHHRLLDRNFTPRSAVLFLYAITAFFCLGSLLILRFTGSLALLLALMASITVWFLFDQLRYEELTALGACAARVCRNARRTLEGEIRARKSARQIEAAVTLEAAWELLIESFAGDFDEISFRLAEPSTRPAPFLPPYQRNDGRPAETAWSVSIPLLAGENPIGELRLCGAVFRTTQVFSLSSLRTTVLPAFETQLTRRYRIGQPPLFSTRVLPRVRQRRIRIVSIKQRKKA